MTRPAIIGLALFVAGCGSGGDIEKVPVTFTTLPERGYCAQTEAITVCKEDLGAGPVVVRQDFDCGEDTSVVIGLLRGVTATIDDARLETASGNQGLQAFAFAVSGDPPAMVINDERYEARSVEDLCDEHVRETGFDGTEGFETLEP